MNHWIYVSTYYFSETLDMYLVRQSTSSYIKCCTFSKTILWITKLLCYPSNVMTSSPLYKVWIDHQHSVCLRPLTSKHHVLLCSLSLLTSSCLSSTPVRYAMWDFSDGTTCYATCVPNMEPVIPQEKVLLIDVRTATSLSAGKMRCNDI